MAGRPWEDMGRKLHAHHAQELRAEPALPTHRCWTSSLELGHEKCLWLEPHRVWSFTAVALANTPTHAEGEKGEGVSLWTPRAAAPPASGSADAPTLPWAVSVILLTTPLLEAPRSHILRFQVCPGADEVATVSHAGRLPRRSPTPPGTWSSPHEGCLNFCLKSFKDM